MRAIPARFARRHAALAARAAALAAAEEQWLDASCQTQAKYPNVHVVRTAIMP